jgi:hypothetical protein
MHLTEITEKIQQLETLYADRLTNNADHKELRPIWKKIQDLRTQFLLTETFESILGHPISLISESSVSSDNTIME